MSELFASPFFGIALSVAPSGWASNIEADRPGPLQSSAHRHCAGLRRAPPPARIPYEDS